MIRARYKLTGWNTNQLKARIPAILTKYGAALDQTLKAEIKAIKYVWPPGRVTRRRNGQTVTSPRDIVDLGGFLRSQERSRPSATELLFRWNAPYSKAILTGYTTTPRVGPGVVVPPRNWVRPALEALPLDRFFADEWKALAKRSL